MPRINDSIPENIKIIIEELKNKLTLILKDNLKEIILFGSYSRGEQGFSSDIDILIILEKIAHIKT